MLYDLAGGFAIYVVVAFDQTDFAGNSYPVPLSFLVPQLNQEAFRLNIAEADMLEYAPTMEGYRAELPATAEWSNDVTRFWSQSAAAPVDRVPLGAGVRGGAASGYFYNPGSGMRALSGPLVRQSQVTGRSVYDEAGTMVGTVAGTVVNVGNGVISYVLTRAEDGQTRYALPLSLFTYDTIEQRLSLSVRRRFLRDAPTYRTGNRPDFADPEWNRTVRSYWVGVNKVVRYRTGLRVTPAEVFQAETLIGYAVVNSERQTLGRISDFLVTRQGNVPYAVVEFAGFLGLGGQRYAVPMSVMELNTAVQQVFFDLDRDQLSQMPGIGELNFRRANADWDQEIRAFWREQLDTALGDFAVGRLDEEEEREDPPAQLATTIMDYAVRAADGTTVGSVDNLLITVDDARLQYGVVLGNAAIRREGESIPLPLDLVPWQISGNSLRVNVSPDAVRNAPAFEVGDRPLRSRPMWDSDIRDYWRDR
jgi:sporulation protein YlmC with PRC-barrel domain